MTKCSLGSLDDLAVGELRHVELGEVPVCLLRLLNGDVHAIGGLCSHEDIELADGEIDGFDVECPAHGSTFDARTGAVDGLPATKPVPVYPVTIERGEIFVEI